ncbi:MFS general substrate transporter [Trametes coccinea BRFM310]|uniref:MFS general substrate transporter n=1 Tax=Trametes coccinea (strain BRFM310) TaxID=1353009 RepID=A0A1Y2IBI9_TRAC3|nr:MFS general substrate transporter [Trametes coccinea BRFM310]
MYILLHSCNQIFLQFRAHATLPILSVQIRRETLHSDVIWLIRNATSPAAKSMKQPKGSAFWLSFLAIVVCNILRALDVTAVSTTLPIITHDLNGSNDFVWVGAAYGLASTAMLPFCGRLADVFGRRPVMMLSVAFFFVGSALSGAAQNMNILIAARTIQGVGGVGIDNMSSINIIISDLLPLVERGAYQGMVVVLAWAFAAAIGPVVEPG